MPNATKLAARAAREAGVPVNLYVALITKGERSYKGWQTSPSGAQGPAQLMPGTAAGLSKKYGINTSDYYGNLLGGAYYLKEQLERFGSPKLAVAAYNAGPGAVEQHGGVPNFEETQRYVKNVFGGMATSAPPPGFHGKPGIPGMPGTIAPPTGKPPTMKVPTFTLSPAPFGDIAKTALEGIGQIASGEMKPTESLGALVDAAATPRQLITTWQKVPVPQRGVRKPALHLDWAAAPHGRVDQAAKNAVKLAHEFLGTPYVWGGAKPGGFDCSGLVQYVWAKQGVKIPRTTYDQFKTGMAVQRRNLRVGDAVFFHPGSRGPEHMGMYIGNGLFIQAPHTGDVVKISKLQGYPGYMGARRYG